MQHEFIGKHRDGSSARYRASMDDGGSVFIEVLEGSEWSICSIVPAAEIEALIASKTGLQTPVR